MLVFWGFWRFDLGLDPDLDIEFDFAEVELLDIAREQSGRSDPSVMHPHDARGDDTSSTEFGEQTARVDELAPANATFFMLMANHRIKSMGYAEDFMTAFSPQRDFKYLVDGGGLHPWNDFDYMLIASSDVRDPFQNFIVVAHKLDERIIRGGIERAARNFDQVAEWETRGGVSLTNPRPADPEAEDRDPRYFVLLDASTAVYVREEFLDTILDPSPTGDDTKTAAGFVANLTKLRQFAADEPDAGFTLVARDLLNATKAGKSTAPWGGELFDDLEFVFEAAQDPQVLATLTFATSPAAASFERYWSETLARKIRGDLKLRFMVGALYESVVIERTGASVRLRAKLTEAQAEAAAKLSAQFAAKLTGQRSTDHEAARAMRARSMAERTEHQRSLDRGDRERAPAVLP
jgi:hypothetical protein